MNVNIKVDIKEAVKNLGKNVKFLQPLFEAITNSLEANATNIRVKIFSDSTLINGFQPMCGFSIEDNGDGFTDNNLDAFQTLWTPNKCKIGCKGSGRFTWLSVYRNIIIDSNIKKGKSIHIEFNEDGIHFDKNNNPNNDSLKESKTHIEFKDIKDKFINRKENVDLTKIKKEIVDYLFIKFFMLKKQGRKFNIEILHLHKIEKIELADINNIESEFIDLKNEECNEKIKFELNYFFSEKQNNLCLHLCAAGRSILKPDLTKFNLPKKLPDSESLILMLSSKYLDKMCDDNRNDFSNLNIEVPNLTVPITMNQILEEVAKKIKQIIKKRYPKIEEQNKLLVQKLIDSNPHLKKYIENNKQIIKDEQSVLDEANEEFHKDKIEKSKKIRVLLKQKNISDDEFNLALDGIKDISYKELGEYIVYRDIIIQALKSKIINNSTENEIHNLFMTKKDSNSSLSQKRLSTNLWLLDDKYMTYSNAFSDKSFKQIADKLNLEEWKTNNDRPDLLIFFDKCEVGKAKDALIIEFKRSKSPNWNKTYAMVELRNYVSNLRNNVKNIKSIWCYAISDIDEVLEKALTDDDYKPLFSNNENKIYYKYHDNFNAHFYYIDYMSVISDASARNSTFMKLLKDDFDIEK